VYEFYTVSNYRDLLFNVKVSFYLLLIISTCELTKVVVLNYSGKNEKTSKTVANRCKKLQRNGTKTKNERRFDVTLGYSITVRDVAMLFYFVWLHLTLNCMYVCSIFSAKLYIKKKHVLLYNMTIGNLAKRTTMLGIVEVCNIILILGANKLVRHTT